MDFETLHALKSINIARMYDQHVLLKSIDEEFFEVIGPVASRSKLLKDRMKEAKDITILQRMFINVNVRSRFLKMVLQFCTYQTECKIEARCRSLPVSTESIDAWNAELIANLDFDEMMALHEAAHHMEVKKLHALTTQKINEFVANMPVEEYLRRHWELLYH